MTERVREQIARWLQKHTDFAGNLEWDDFDEDAQECFRLKADNFFEAIDGLEIRASNQEMPETQIQTRRTDVIGLRDNEIRMAGFVKVLK